MPEVRILQDVGDAAYDTAHRFPGGIAALAVRMGMSASTLDKKVNLHNDTHHLSLREAMKLQHVTRDYSILHAMAGGLQHVAIADASEVGGDVGQRLQRIGAEVGDVFRSTLDALDDQRIDAQERKVIRREVAQAIAELSRLLQVI